MLLQPVPKQSVYQESVVSSDEDILDFAYSVSTGLTTNPKRLECQYLYDSYGSALFELICEQPEYYLTRVEASILSMCVDEVTKLTGPVSVVELGAGSAAKTTILLSSYCLHYGEANYIPIDISRSSLLRAERQLQTVLPEVSCVPIHATNDQGMQLVSRDNPLMMLFLGSSMGNLDHTEMSELWRTWSTQLQSGDFLLLGVDINTDAVALNAAYNDSCGVTEAFTRNIFSRMNRELGSDINVEAIEHVAAYNASAHQVEIFARFQQSQLIEIPILGIEHQIVEGEMIQTEISRRFDTASLEKNAAFYGFKTERIYQDAARRFAVLLLKKP